MAPSYRDATTTEFLEIVGLAADLDSLRDLPHLAECYLPETTPGRVAPGARDAAVRPSFDDGKTLNELTSRCISSILVTLRGLFLRDMA